MAAPLHIPKGLCHPRIPDERYGISKYLSVSTVPLQSRCITPEEFSPPSSHSVQWKATRTDTETYQKFQAESSILSFTSSTAPRLTSNTYLKKVSIFGLQRFTFLTSLFQINSSIEINATFWKQEIRFEGRKTDIIKVRKY